MARNFAKPYENKDVKVEQEPVQQEQVQEPIQQEKEEEVVITTSNTGTSNVSEPVVKNSVVKKSFKRYIDRLNEPKTNDTEVKTTVYLDEDLYDKLSEICYRKQGLKKIIINTALEDFIESGEAELLAKEIDKARKDQKDLQRKRISRVSDKFGLDD